MLAQILLSSNKERDQKEPRQARNQPAPGRSSAAGACYAGRRLRHERWPGGRYADDVRYLRR
jgi:hypothetical protein